MSTKQSWWKRLLAVVRQGLELPTSNQVLVYQDHKTGNYYLNVPGDLVINVQGRVRITGQQDVILRSGNQFGGEGLIYLNSPEDENGNPIWYPDPLPYDDGMIIPADHIHTEGDNHEPDATRPGNVEPPVQSNP